MKDPYFHQFDSSAEGIPLPPAFTFPFHYTPHPLTLMAAEEVQAYLHTQTEWKDELDKGKMFGVLVVQTSDMEVGYLTAFSGNLMGSNHQDSFVPPVYDMLNPDGFFRQEEAAISVINHQIEEKEKDEAYLHMHARYQQTANYCQAELQAAKDRLKQAKLQRDKLREAGISPEEEAKLIRESQFQKAEYKRLGRNLKAQMEKEAEPLSLVEKQIQELKHERKTRSAALQQWLFRQFRLLNARGEVKDLCQIFQDTPQGIPPAGAGECALPKLLQYAYLHQMHPVCMGEFWYGQSPKDEIRKEGCFYPSCKHKCEPILKHMLIGLDTEPNPLALSDKSFSLETVYEDNWLIVVNKPCGLLSTPGKLTSLSVFSLLQEKYGIHSGIYIVHRLDMATSGLLLVAKTPEVYRSLQAMFADRRIEKRYTAWLDGILTSDEGIISLPICPNYSDRPRQMVHPEGKPAITRYQVRERRNGQTLVSFYPLTGRTHQLRIHAAHPDGLNTPIAGDELYGKKAERLYLHAAELRFTHPVTRQLVVVCKEADFMQAYSSGRN